MRTKLALKGKFIAVLTFRTAFWDTQATSVEPIFVKGRIE